MRISRLLHIQIPQLLMAAGVVLFSLEMAHPELPFWADLFFTLGVVVYLNALGAAYDFFILLEERSKKD